MTEPVVPLLQRAIAGAVHDLRHPVTVMEGQRRLLADGLLGPLTPAMSQAMEALERQTVRMTRILEELDAVSRRDVGPVTDFDLALVVEEQWRARFASPPPALVSVRIQGDRPACAALIAEVLASAGPEVQVALRTVAPSGVLLSLRCAPGGCLDDLGEDVLWCSRVVARWHGGHLTIDRHGGNGAELRVRIATRTGSKTGPLQVEG